MARQATRDIPTTRLELARDLSFSLVNDVLIRAASYLDLHTMFSGALCRDPIDVCDFYASVVQQPYDAPHAAHAATVQLHQPRCQ